MKIFNDVMRRFFVATLLIAAMQGCSSDSSSGGISSASAAPTKTCWDGTVVRKNKPCPVKLTPPPPPPATQTCWDGSVILATSACPVKPPPPPPPAPTQTCWDGSIIPTTSACPVQPPPPPTTTVEPSYGTRVAATKACISTMKISDVLAIGAYYDVMAIGGGVPVDFTPLASVSTEFVVLLPYPRDAAHWGDGYYAIWVPVSCVKGV